MDKYYYSIEKIIFSDDLPEEEKITFLERKFTSDLKECFDKATEFKASHPKSFFEMNGWAGATVEGAADDGTDVFTHAGFMIIEEDDIQGIVFTFAVIHQDAYSWPLNK